MSKSNYIKKPRFNKKRGISTTSQYQKILLNFPNALTLRRKGNSFVVVLKLRPTPMSRTYDVKIVFDKYEGVEVYVINEVLKVAERRTKLPHVYSHSEQRLCLYSISKQEWNREKLLVSTIIPWTSDWLFYYELWLPNGEWYGGGHDEYRET